MDDLDRMLSGGAKSAKFEREGDTITGTVDEVMVRQATEYGTGKPLTFDNGDPREQIVVVLKDTGIIPEDENDDGFRAVYIKGWGQQRRAFIQAVRDGGKPTRGARFTATFTRSEPSKAGGFPAKVFEYRIEAGTGAVLDDYTVPTAEVEQATEQAMKLLGMGTFTPAQVAAATGLSVQEVEAMLPADDDRTPF